VGGGEGRGSAAGLDRRRRREGKYAARPRIERFGAMRDPGRVLGPQRGGPWREERRKGAAALGARATCGAKISAHRRGADGDAAREVGGLGGAHPEGGGGLEAGEVAERGLRGRGVEAERVSRARARWARRRRCAGRGGGPERPAARRGAARARAGGTRIPRRGSPRRATPAPCIAAAAPAPGPRGPPGPKAGGGRGGRGRPGRAHAPWWPCARRARRRRAWARSSRGCQPSWGRYGMRGVKGRYGRGRWGAGGGAEERIRAVAGGRVALPDRDTFLGSAEVGAGDLL
jgi:hypothetical protein